MKKTERIKPSQAHIEFKLQERVKELTGEWYEVGMTLNDCGLDSLGFVELGLFIEDAFIKETLSYTEIQLTPKDTITAAAEKIYKHLHKGETNDKTT